MIDKCVIISISACVYTAIVSPMLMYATMDLTGLSAAAKLQAIMTPRLENKIVWPALAAITVILAVRNRSRLTLPPHIVCLLAYLALAGASVLWALKPEFSFSRYVLQVMIVTSIVLPAMVAGPTADMMRGVFFCFAFASILNIFFVLGQKPSMLPEWHMGVLTQVSIGYKGYFSFKGVLGECAAIAFLLSLHEMLYPGLRRALGIIVVVIAIWLAFVSKSKGSFAMAIVAPLVAQLALITAKKMRISPAIVLLPIPICYELLSRIPGLNLINRISYKLYGNYTLSGRMFIWNFVHDEIARSPLFGWGYQSFWLVGSDAPSVVEAPGFVRAMPSAHNGYLDITLDTGYVGLTLFVIFIIATLHAVGRVADRGPARAWLLLSLALFIILTNSLESVWMHGMDLLWIVFAIVAAETGRCWQSFRPDCRSHSYSRKLVRA
jgi:exopolysaccharide production protein ExoQ